MFLKPIEARSLLPAEVNQAIFGNIEHILSLNKELYTCIRQKGPVDAFINMGPFLKVYAVYADNYNGALEMLNVRALCLTLSVNQMTAKPQVLYDTQCFSSIVIHFK